ncbi:acyl-CoA dehydrogenase family protein, partial [Francisella tularensis]|uniref:acyl-CoA dehydrogenase family protein n=1 Tax=Francisella tularensis TaxID=263 RepID=UPI002381C471
QFKVPIAKFEVVQEKLDKTAGLAYIANDTRQFTVAAVDSGLRPSVSSAIAKYHITEMGRTTINNAMDIHGGRAIIMGP